MSSNVTAVSTRRPRVGVLGLWVVQVVLASQFVGAGFVKVTGDPALVEMFGEIGAGQWLRYLVGVLELAGAAGLLVPRLAGLAALGLTGLMAGAVVTNVAVLGTAPWLPVAFGLAAALVAWVRRDQIRTLVRWW